MFFSFSLVSNDQIFQSVITLQLIFNSKKTIYSIKMIQFLSHQQLKTSNSFKSKASDKILVWKAGRNSTLKHITLIQKLISHYYSSLALEFGMNFIFQGGAHSPWTLLLRAVSKGSSNAKAHIPYSAECSKQGNSFISADTSKGCVWDSNNICTSLCLTLFRIQIFNVWTFSVGCFSFNVSGSLGLSDFHFAGGLYLDL